MIIEHAHLIGAARRHQSESQKTLKTKSVNKITHFQLIDGGWRDIMDSNWQLQADVNDTQVTLYLVKQGCKQKIERIFCVVSPDIFMSGALESCLGTLYSLVFVITCFLPSYLPSEGHTNHRVQEES